MASTLLGITRKPIYYPTAVVNATANYTSTTDSVGYTTLIFTSSGVLSVYDAPAMVEVLMVGGGGGGGGAIGGGGGAGGLIQSTNVVIPPGIHTVSIGAGGGGGASSNLGYIGGDTSIGNVVVAFGGGAAGGSNGVNYTDYTTYAQYNGGSGGGQGRANNGGTIGSGLQPIYKFRVGNGVYNGLGTGGGGGVSNGQDHCGGGGGGAWSSGTYGLNSAGVVGAPTNVGAGFPGNGGYGTFTTMISTTLGISLGVGQYITATNAMYFGGGGGGGGSIQYGINSRGSTSAQPGIGGGGYGSTGTFAATSGQKYTGGGGGGGCEGVTQYNQGGSGGSGVVILRYLTNLYTSTIRTTTITQPIKTDPYFNNNTLLISGQTTSSIYTNNATILDSSYSTAFSTLSTGTGLSSFPQTGAFSPFGNNWSVHFNGSTDFLTIPQNAVFSFGTGSFTVEGWYFFNSFVQEQCLVALGSGSVSGANFTGWWLRYTPYYNGVGGVPTLGFYRYNGTTETILNFILDTSNALQTGQWYHIACTRNGTNLSMFLNGTQVGSTATSTTSYDAINTDFLYIGRIITGASVSYFLNGYASNVRIVKGAALYASNFAVPIAPLSVTTQTVLLTCASNRFTDKAETLYLFTATNINGTPKISTFSPFLKNRTYTNVIDGGSVYYNGTNDVTGFTQPLLNTAFTIDFWVYNYSVTGFFYVSASGPLLYNTNPIQFNRQGGGVGGTAPTGYYALQYSWNHIVFMRENATTGAQSYYLNGVLLVQASSGYTQSDGPAVTTGIGSDRGQSSWGSKMGEGYISNFRLVKSAVYTTGNTTIGRKYFDPPSGPTVPIDSTTSTSLLMQGTSGGIINWAAPSNLRDIRPQGSAYFATTQSCLVVTGSFNSRWGFGLADFTVEMWIYPVLANPGLEYNLFACTTTNALTIFKPANGTLSYKPYGGTSVTIYNGTISAGTWTHIALTRSAGISYGFVNGLMTTSTADTTSYTSPASALFPYTIGSLYTRVFGFSGYITGVNVVRDKALYTSTFVTSTYAPVMINPFTTSTTSTSYGNTLLLLRMPNATLFNTDHSANAFAMTTAQAVTAPAYNKLTPFNTPTLVNKTFAPGSQGSLYLGVGRYVTTSTNSTPPLTTLNVITSQDFTFECWYNHVSADGMNSPTIFSNYNSFGNSFAFWPYRADDPAGIGAAGKIQVAIGSNIYGSYISSIFGVWIHVAVVRLSDTVTLYVNGLKSPGFVQTNSSAITGSGNGLYIGTTGDSIVSGYFNGYISNLRWVTGTAVYTDDFTPSKIPLTAITNTKLLLNTTVSEVYKDSSTSSITLSEISVSSTVSTSFNSPFVPNVVNLNDRCLYFSGNGQYLAHPLNPINALGSSDFTIEMWIYIITLSTNAFVISQGTAGTGSFRFVINTDATGAATGNTGLFTEATTTRLTFTAGSFLPGKWIHVAISRSASLIKGFINGSLNVYAPSTYDYSDTSIIYLGSNPGTVRQDFHGYMDDIRITKGVARYVGNFNTPLIPPPLK